MNRIKEEVMKMMKYTLVLALLVVYVSAEDFTKFIEHYCNGNPSPDERIEYKKCQKIFPETVRLKLN